MLVAGALAWFGIVFACERLLPLQTLWIKSPNGADAPSLGDLYNGYKWVAFPRTPAAVALALWLSLGGLTPIAQPESGYILCGMLPLFGVCAYADILRIRGFIGKS
ncbi:MAG TPA: hypothetical protein VG407_17720 [Caulobacteraceae bacterium]|jgi:hypothetical protein|nr:hypothetical protein [Caulobacteraceae bacterium]